MATQMSALERLASALVDQREELMARWRQQVRALPSAAALDVPTLNDHIPGWILQLAQALRAAHPQAPGVDATEPVPVAHGEQRFEDGFDIEEVVGEYKILRQCVHEVADAMELDLRGVSRRVVDREFDDAIAGAVKAFAESQAREVQRRRAEHLAFIAHDLRTPLSAITFAAHILHTRLGGQDADPEMPRLLKTLGRNAKQLEALVGHVLKENTQLLTELGVQVERRAFDLWPVVEVLLQDMQAIAMKSATRVVNSVPDDLEVKADAGLVRRILQNLIANALSYTPGGVVTIGARDLSGEDAVECWVQDNGAGIPAERIARVFDALETDPERDRTGLGLAIVKTFVEAHGGVVKVESVEGSGSTFRFTLPRTAPAVEASTRPALKVATSPQAG